MSSARSSRFTCPWLLRYRSRWARLVLWILVIETVIDLVNATIQGIRNDVFTTANGVTWVILNFYVPLLWVTLALILWAAHVTGAGPAISDPGRPNQHGLRDMTSSNW